MKKRKSIIIADADSYLSGIYARRFEMARFEVRVAEDQQQVIKLVAEKRPDVLLIDSQSIEQANNLIRQFRSNPKTATVTVVVLTELGHSQAVTEAIQAGADSYILKGHFVPVEVIAKVERLVAGS
ncbi:response regulator [Patescibacteria group bacterium]